MIFSNLNSYIPPAQVIEIPFKFSINAQVVLEAVMDL